MKIIIFGAGSMGSLFGGLLSQENHVVLIGRKKHIQAIIKNGLKIVGKTKLKVKIDAYESIKNIDFTPDLIILTVKSYDTEKAIKQIKQVFGDNTYLLTMQNGLDNMEKIKKEIKSGKILGGVTTHGALLSKPGVVNHTGFGSTIIGSLNDKPQIIEKIISVFNKAAIKTESTSNLLQEIWIKAIINSCINPLTTFFNCKNGYLIKNPILKDITEKVCRESTRVAQAEKINVSYQNMIKSTIEVIQNTSENYSSMLQSYYLGRQTEIDSINEKIVAIGKKHGVDVSFNKILVNLVKSLY